MHEPMQLPDISLLAPGHERHCVDDGPKQVAQLESQYAQLLADTLYWLANGQVVLSTQVGSAEYVLVQAVQAVAELQVKHCGGQVKHELDDGSG